MLLAIDLMFDVLLAMVQVDVDVDVELMLICSRRFDDLGIFLLLLRAGLYEDLFFVGFKSCNYSALPVKVEFYSSTI